MLELVFEDGGVTHRIPVKDGLSLGRSSDNDVVLRDFSVSRHHAKVEEANGAYRIVSGDHWIVFFSGPSRLMIAATPSR